MAGVAVLSQKRHALTGTKLGDAGSDSLYRSPAFVAEPAGLGREVHPVRPAPWPQVRRADPATLDPHTDLVVFRSAQDKVDHTDSAGSLHPCGKAGRSSRGAASGGDFRDMSVHGHSPSASMGNGAAATPFQRPRTTRSHGLCSGR